MKIGYIRCSTAEQNEARQLKLMEELHAEKIFLDKLSGKDTQRPQFQEMLSFARQGDTIMVESISRLARNTKDLLETIDLLSQKGIDFYSSKESIDTQTPQGKFMLTVFSAMAELERQNILQRQQEGIAIAKEAGKYLGKPPIKIDEDKFRQVCSRWRNGKITATEAMQILGLKPNTFYRRVKQIGV